MEVKKMTTMGTNYHVIREVLLATPQAFTTSWADLGAEVDVRGYNSLGIWIRLGIGEANNMRLRVLAKLDKA